LELGVTWVRITDVLPCFVVDLQQLPKDGFAALYWSLADLSVGLLGRGDQPSERPLPTHRVTLKYNNHTDIHATNGTGTHDPNVYAVEGSSC
jgi:hypothetical protein